MSAYSTRKANILAAFVLAVGCGYSAGTDEAAAQQTRSTNQIIEALKPAPRTRSLTATPADTARRAEDARFVDTLRNRLTRSLTTEERTKIATITKEKPSIDLEINFEYNSDRISPATMPQVTALAQALSSPELKGSTFVLAGHTDAKGGDTFNQGLSERRAETVRRFLKEKFNLDDGKLVTVGYGRTQLKNQSNPAAAENRRVQVVNVAN